MRAVRRARSPQAYYYYGPFGLLGEYVIPTQQVRKAANSVEFGQSAWEISGSWVLTGEDRHTTASRRCIHSVRTTISGARGSWWRGMPPLDVDGKAFTADGGNYFANSAAFSGLRGNAWSLGVNWYLNKNLRAGFELRAHASSDGL